MNDTPESDRLDDTPHPRETTRLIGHGEAEHALLEAYRSGRIPHAWILSGPEGIGKATLAYRMAKFVMANPDPARTGACTDLSTNPDLPPVRQVAVQSHVDLTVLRRGWNAEKKRFFGDISVDDVRKVTSFFGSTAGAGGWRVAIIDTADDLNRSGANALLKVLEEPPAKSLFLMVSHLPGRLLPTIRSRCRVLPMAALPGSLVLEAASLARPDLAEATLAATLPLAGGRVRRAIALAESNGAALHRALLAVLETLPDLDLRAAHRLADSCSGKAGEEAFGLLLTFLEDWLHQRALQDQGGPVHRLARWAEVWEKAHEAARDVEVYNLDRKPFILSTLSMLARASRS